METAPATLQDLPPEVRALVEGLLAEKEAIIEKLGADLEKLRAQFELMLKKMFGRSSEKLDPNQLLMDALMLQAQDTFAEPVPDAPVAEAVVAAVAKPSKRNGRMPIADHLKRNEIVLDVPESEKICPVTGKERPCIGEEVTEKYHYVRETLEVNRYIRKKYGSPMGAEENGVLTAPLPASLLPRCLADASMLSHIAVSKFDDHLPLHRLEKMFLRQGAQISRKTMSDWMRNLAEGLRPLEKRIAEKILSCGVVHHDDTPVDRLDPGAGQAKEGRVWVAVSGQGPPLVHFSFTPNRKQAHVLSFFRGYSGAVMCDEYAGYANVEYGVMQSCWAHARRKIIEKCKGQAPYQARVLLEIQKLYGIEDRIRDASAEDRARVRDTESRAQLAKVFEAVESRSDTPGSDPGKAQQYILGHRKQLSAFVEDERLPIDNNAAERAIRRVAIGRKNWLFLGSENGGATAATLMSLLGTCWANRVN
ncbi:MAG: IS66 family transposase, partial [Kiritimatiellae bacterium]|nr:IS66 family transposase [Kiritimatiellia bacterium]